MSEFHFSSLYYVVGLAVFGFLLLKLYQYLGTKKYKHAAVLGLFMVALSMGFVRVDPSQERDQMRSKTQKQLHQKSKNVPPPVLHNKKSNEDRMAEKHSKLRNQSDELIDDYLQHEDKEDEKN